MQGKLNELCTIYKIDSTGRQLIEELIVEALTEKLDTSEMLPNWQRYWQEVRPGRFVCTCGECENGDKIIKLLLTLTSK